jgi:hypothetical protein
MEANMGVWLVVGLSILVVCMLIGVWWYIKEMRKRHQESINPHNWEVGYVHTREGERRYIVAYKDERMSFGDWEHESTARYVLGAHRRNWDRKLLDGQKPIIVRDKP